MLLKLFTLWGQWRRFYVHRSCHVFSWYPRKHDMALLSIIAECKFYLHVCLSLAIVTKSYCVDYEFVLKYTIVENTLIIFLSAPCNKINRKLNQGKQIYIVNIFIQRSECTALERVLAKSHYGLNRSKGIRTSHLSPSHPNGHCKWKYNYQIKTIK